MFGWLPNPFIVPVGFAIGLLIAVPVGPVNVLCIQRSMERGLFAGVVAGSGAVLADGLIALLAALGVGAISGLVRDYRTAIQLIGGLALLAFGLRLLLATPELELIRQEPFNRSQLRGVFRDLFWDLPKAFFLTITNPGAVLGLFAIFGGISSFVEIRGPVEALIMVAAIMTGSLAWWITLSGIVGLIRSRIDAAWMGRINGFAGVLLLLFGLVLCGELLFVVTA
ncbi:MAG: LysE family transporter [Pseudomonadota bacterium]